MEKKKSPRQIEAEELDREMENRFEPPKTSSTAEKNLKCNLEIALLGKNPLTGEDGDYEAAKEIYGKLLVEGKIKKVTVANQKDLNILQDLDFSSGSLLDKVVHKSIRFKDKKDDAKEDTSGVEMVTEALKKQKLIALMALKEKYDKSNIPIPQKDIAALKVSGCPPNSVFDIDYNFLDKHADRLNESYGKTKPPSKKKQRVDNEDDSDSEEEDEAKVEKSSKKDDEKDDDSEEDGSKSNNNSSDENGDSKKSNSDEDDDSDSNSKNSTLDENNNSEVKDKKDTVNDNHSVESESKLLHGKNILVMGGIGCAGKQDLVTKIKAEGGHVVGNFTKKVDAVFAEDHNTSTAIKAGEMNIPVLKFAQFEAFLEDPKRTAQSEE